MILFSDLAMILFFLFLLFGEIYALPPQVRSLKVFPTGKFKPRQKDTARFQCDTRGATRVEFLKNGNVLSSTTDSRISKSGSSLSISNLDHTKDDGTYQCKAINSKGVVLSVPLNFKVTVLGKFQFPFQVRDQIRFISVTIGRPFKLACPSHTYTYPREIIWGNAPQVGQPRVLTTNKRRFQLANGDIFFTHLQQGDINEINNQMNGVSCFLYHNGPYIQSVRFKLTPVATLQTDTSPRLREGIPTNNDAIQGKEFSFYCAAGGKPTPDIVWYQPDGGRITPNNIGYIISPSGNKLTVRNAVARYSGKYKCDISNRVGKVSSEGNLNIKVEPSWQRQLNDVVAQQNGNVQFSCVATGSGVINYSWYKNGRLINKSNETYTVNGGSLIIKNINSTDYGMVQCFAKSPYGEIKSSAFLNVQGAVIPKDKDIETDGEKLHYGYIILIVGGGAAVIGTTGAIVYFYLH